MAMCQKWYSFIMETHTHIDIDIDTDTSTLDQSNNRDYEIYEMRSNSNTENRVRC